jgi:hypothetical protein
VGQIDRLLRLGHADFHVNVGNMMSLPCVLRIVDTIVPSRTDVLYYQHVYLRPCAFVNCDWLRVVLRGTVLHLSAWIARGSVACAIPDQGRGWCLGFEGTKQFCNWFLCTISLLLPASISYLHCQSLPLYSCCIPAPSFLPPVKNLMRLPSNYLP